MDVAVASDWWLACCGYKAASSPRKRAREDVMAFYMAGIHV